MRNYNSRETDFNEKNNEEGILEYYNVLSKPSNTFCFRVGEKVFFGRDRSFEELNSGKRIVLKKGDTAIVTNRYSLLIGDKEVHITDDIVIYGNSSSGFMSLFRKELRGDQFNSLDAGQKSDILKAVEDVFTKLNIKNL